MIWLYIRVLLVYLEIWISPVTCAVDSSCSTSQMLSNWCPTILLMLTASQGAMSCKPGTESTEQLRTGDSRLLCRLDSALLPSYGYIDYKSSLSF